MLEMVQQWQQCMAPDWNRGCCITKCPLSRKVVVETEGDVTITGAQATLTFQGCSLVGTLEELVKSGWSQEPFKGEDA